MTNGPSSNDKRRLVNALREVKAKDYQYTMAGILLAQNGIDNALSYVYGLRERGLTNAALAAPDAAGKLPDDGTCECGHFRGQHRDDKICMIFPCECNKYAPQPPASQDGAALLGIGRQAAAARAAGVCRKLGALTLYQACAMWGKRE